MDGPSPCRPAASWFDRPLPFINLTPSSATGLSGVALAAVVLVPRFPDLWRVADRVGRGSVLRIAFLTALLRLSPRLRRQTSRMVPVWVVPALSVGFMAVAAALSRPANGKRGARLAKQLLHVLLVASAPLKLADAVDDVAEADIIAILGMVLGVALNRTFASTMLLLMLTGGEALEEYAMERAGQALHDVVRRRMPARAVRVVAPRGNDRGAGHGVGERRAEEVPTEDVCEGNELLLREGQIVPVDCELVAGTCDVDESAVTGEKVARCVRAVDDDRKQEHSSLLSGSVIRKSDGVVVVRCNRTAGRSTFALMAGALEQAMERKGKMERRAAQTATLFAPLTLVVAALALRRFRARGASLGVQWEAVLSVLMASTTCPLQIGVPVSFLAGMSVARRAGITIKCGEALEALGSASMVVLDKTGTLTTGSPEVTAVRSVPSGPGGVCYGPFQLLSFAHSVEYSSTHVLALAVRRHVARIAHDNVGVVSGWRGDDSSSSSEGVEDSFSCALPRLYPVRNDSVRVVAGKGVAATVELPESEEGGGGEGGAGAVVAGGKGARRRIEARAGTGGGWIEAKKPRRGRKVVVGSAAFLEEEGVQEIQRCVSAAAGGDSRLSSSSSSSSPFLPVYIAVDGVASGYILFEDSLRPSGVRLVERLKRRGLRVAILSGDRSSRLKQVADALGVKEAISCLPHEKMAQVVKWKRCCERVVMVGDGSNDAPALAASDVGISVGTQSGGTALASESADVVMLASRRGKGLKRASNNGGGGGGVTGDDDQDLTCVDTALDLGRCVVSTARIGVVGGMGCSAVQMAMAYFGVLSPFANSCIQELVDLGAILNSLRVLLWEPNSGETQTD